MNLSPEYRWRRYKADFLRHNRCTVDQFEADYVAFQERKPTIADYRKFARKYGITIHSDPYIPSDLQAVLCVNIAVIKVMAETYEESRTAVENILSSKKKETDDA